MRLTGGSGDERGSVLALVPAGFLVLIILAALAVDSAVAYEGQQQLHDTLVAAANDAASSAIDRPVFYATGTVAISPSQAGQVVCSSLLSQHSSQLHETRVWLAVQGASVRLIGESRVTVVFGRAVPGFGTRHVRATVDAIAATAPGQRPAADVVRQAPVPLVCS